MKKFILSAVVLATALLFTSCEKSIQNIDPSKLDNTTFKCWKVTMKVHGVTVTDYMWATERILVESLQAEQKYAGINSTYAPTSKNEKQCTEAMLGE